MVLVDTGPIYGCPGQSAVASLRRGCGPSGSDRGCHPATDSPEYHAE